MQSESLFSSNASYSGCMKFSCAPRKKNNNQEVYFLNPWEFLTYWEIKLLPADKTSVESLAKRGVRASSKNEIQECIATFHAKILKALYIYVHTYTLK